MGKHRYWIGVVVLLAFAGPPPGADVCLHLSLDSGATEPEIGGGDVIVGSGMPVAGISGEGLRVQEPSQPPFDPPRLEQIAFASACGGTDAYPSKGTWMVWVRPETWSTVVGDKANMLYGTPVKFYLERNIYPVAITENVPYPAIQMRHNLDSYAAAKPDASWGPGNGWHHLAYTYDSSTGLGQAYINGIVLKENRPKPPNDWSGMHTLSSLFIGSQEGTNVLNGAIDDVIFVDEVLTGDGIREVYDAYFDAGQDPVAVADLLVEEQVPAMPPGDGTVNLIREGARFEAGIDGFDIKHRVVYDSGSAERPQGGFDFSPALFQPLVDGTKGLRLDIEPGDEAIVAFDAVSISEYQGTTPYIQVCINARLGKPDPGGDPDPYFQQSKGGDGKSATTRAPACPGGGSETTIHFNLRKANGLWPQMSGQCALPGDGYFRTLKVVRNGSADPDDPMGFLYFGDEDPADAAWRNDRFQFYIVARKTAAADTKTVTIDNVSVLHVPDENGVPCVSPPEENDLAFSLNANAQYAIYDVGATANHTVLLYNFGGSGRSLDVHSEVTDWKGNVVWTDDRNVSVGASSAQTVALAIPTTGLGSERGFFVLESAVSEGGTELEREKSAFAVIQPVVRAPGAEPIPFGTHLKIHALTTRNQTQGGYPAYLRQSLPALADIVERAGIERIREFGVLSWSNVETTNDSFSFADNFVDFLTIDHGFRLYGILGSHPPTFPAWVCNTTADACCSQGNDCSGTPGNRANSCLLPSEGTGPGLGDWVDYLEEVFQHYQTTFEDYEIINEPSFFYHPCEYAELAEAAADAHAASLASGTTLVAPATGSGYTDGQFGYLSKLAPLMPQAGIADEHSEHFYPGVRFPEGNISSPLEGRIDFVKPYAKEITGGNKPTILDSESGYKVRPVRDLGHYQHDGLPAILAHYLYGANEVRHFMIESFAAEEPGLPDFRRYQFAMQSVNRSHHQPSTRSMIEFDGTPSGAYPAIAAFNGIVGASDPDEKLAGYDPFVAGYLYDGEDGKPLVAATDWDYRNGTMGTRAIDVCLDPALVEVRDLYGNLFAPTPVGSGFRLTLEPGPTYVKGLGNKTAFRNAMRDALDGTCSL